METSSPQIKNASGKFPSGDEGDEHHNESSSDLDDKEYDPEDPKDPADKESDDNDVKKVDVPIRGDELKQLLLQQEKRT